MPMGTGSVSNVVTRGTTLPRQPFRILQRETMSYKQSNVCTPQNRKNSLGVFFPGNPTISQEIPGDPRRSQGDSRRSQGNPGRILWDFRGSPQTSNHRRISSCFRYPSKLILMVLLCLHRRHLCQFHPSP